MVTKIFNAKTITIRKLSDKDLRNVKKFQEFINSLIEEKPMILMNKKVSLKEEVGWLKSRLEKVKKKNSVVLVAEYNNVIIGNCHIDLQRGRSSHVGEFATSIRNGFRGVGLGKYLMGEIIKLARKELKPRPKILRLSVFPINKPALALYKKFGFKSVARIPKQLEYKGKLMDEIVMIREL